MSDLSDHKELAALPRKRIPPLPPTYAKATVGKLIISIIYKYRNDMWYVYGLICKDGSLYIGSTGNLKRRIVEHNSGKSLGIKGRLPCHLEFYLAVKSKHISREIEKYFKTGSGKAIIKKKIFNEPKP